MKGFRVKKATQRDIDVLASQRYMMFEDIRHRYSNEHTIGDDAYRT